jgi:hypothetical protein
MGRYGLRPPGQGGVAIEGNRGLPISCGTDRLCPISLSATALKVDSMWRLGPHRCAGRFQHGSEQPDFFATRNSIEEPNHVKE